jgi:hypothetical protein
MTEPLANMGPHLRGVSPPFTPSGKAAFTAANSSYTASTDARNQAGHAGILARWRTNRSNAEMLLPHPLEPNDRTDQIVLFLNKTQTGKSREFILHETPELMNWHEALFMIPCSLSRQPVLFVWALYKDAHFDSGIAQGIFRGFVTKAAQFATLWPFAGQPLNRDMAPGHVARMLVSRMGEKIVDCSFKATKELSRAEIDERIDRTELLSDVGLRYLPDWAAGSQAPLVHDLVLWPMGEGAISRAWAGELDLRLGESDADELDLLRPIEMLPSHFIWLRYQEGSGIPRVAHDYVSRTIRDGRVVRSIRERVGTVLRGESPPFTPSGRAAYLRSTNLSASEPAQAGHIGILARWRAERRNVEMLLPKPLELSETSDQIYLFLNQTQSALNIHRPSGAEDMDYLRDLNPHHVSWHEALFMIPCLCEGRPAAFVPVQYKDVDHSVPLGMADGFWTKLATFHETFPFGPQPLNSEMASGGMARMNVSRFDERIITCEFTATRELTHAETLAAIDIHEFLNDVGIRYWPDYARPGEPPLVHDLIVYDMSALGDERLGKGDIARCWEGDVKLSFGRSDYEELYLLDPIETLPSYFIHLEYQGGAAACRVVHDYVAQPLSR